MTTIRMNRSMNVAGSVHRRGAVVSVDDDCAELLVSAGHADRVEVLLAPTVVEVDVIDTTPERAVPGGPPEITGRVSSRPMRTITRH